MTKAALGLLVSGFLVGASQGWVALPGAQAADHGDGPGVKGDPTTDIGDVFAWMSPDASRMYLAMTVFPSAAPGARFSNRAAYVFHVDALGVYGDAAPARSTVVCTFDTGQTLSCWGPEGSAEYLHGDASGTGGLVSTSGKIQVFAGLRDDAFFWNAPGYRATLASLVKSLGQDPGGCPGVVSGNAAGLLRASLRSDGTGGPGRDAFRPGGAAGSGAYSGNTLAIVVSIDRELLGDSTRPIRAVWGSTHAVR